MGSPTQPGTPSGPHGTAPPLRPVRLGHTVSDAALAEDVSGVPGVVAELAAELGHGVLDRLRVAPAHRPPRPVLEGLEGAHPAGVERERVQQPVLGAVSGTGARPR